MASSSSSLILFSVFLFFFFFFTFIPTNQAATLNAAEFVEQMLDGHNMARQMVSVPPLVYEPVLVRYARVYANERRHDCKPTYSPSFGFGENIFVGQGPNWSAKDVVDAWVSEKQWYNYANNTCLAGKDCTDYTQVVWRNTIRVGCARIICDNGNTLVTCEYYPPGNYVGAKPY